VVRGGVELSTFRFSGCLTVGSQLPLPWSVPVCLVPDSCSVLPVLAPFWHADGTARVLVALVLVVFWSRRERALSGWGFILSPSATLRVAGQSPRVKVERPAGRTTLARGLWSARPVLADGEWMDLNNCGPLQSVPNCAKHAVR
jgi:hypothetical protein